MVKVCMGKAVSVVSCIGMSSSDAYPESILIRPAADLECDYSTA